MFDRVLSTPLDHILKVMFTEARSSHQRFSIKTAVLKSFAILTAILTGDSGASLSKRECNADVFRQILQNL